MMLLAGWQRDFRCKTETVRAKTEDVGLYLTPDWKWRLKWYLPGCW